MSRLPFRLKLFWPYLKPAYTAWTQVFGIVARRVDAKRQGWLPARAAASTEQALDRPAVGALHLLTPATRVWRAAPTGAPPNLPVFTRQLCLDLRAQAVLDLPNGRVLGASRAVITSDGTMLNDEIRYFGTRRWTQNPVFLRLNCPDPVDLDGEVVVLATRGDSNYYHFIHDVVPRLGVLDRWDGLSTSPRFYVPRSNGFQRECLDMLGLSPESIVDADAVGHIRAERLIVPRVADLDLNHPGWAVDDVRQRLLPAGIGIVPGRRIYVTRGRAPRSRIVTNEAEVLSALETYGFEVVDPGALSVAAQIAIFASAEVIVAPHGAALANLAFASPGASVVEMFAPDFVQGCYWKLSTCVSGLQYRYLVGRGHATRMREGRGVSSDIEIDSNSLRDIVEQVLSGS